MGLRGPKPGEKPKGKTGGRKKGTPNKATAEIKSVAQKYGKDAVERLAHLMKKAESEQAQVAACKELLDRGYGKAPQAITGDGGGPVETKVILSFD